MKGLKASIMLIAVTITICAVIIGGSFGYIKAAGAGLIRPEIVIGEGTFPKGMYYIYSNEKGIYNVEYDSRDEVTLYDPLTGSHSEYLKPIRANRKIHGFYSSPNYVIWEEDNENLTDDEDRNNICSWDIYIRKDKQIIKIDGGETGGADSMDEVLTIPRQLSVYGDYLVYKTYDSIPGTGDMGVVLKLYDIASNKSKIIYSLVDIENADISDPYIFDNYIVWSSEEVADRNSGDIDRANIYVYSINTSNYEKVIEEDTLVNPMIWGDYIVCSRKDNKNLSLVLYNFKTKESRNILKSNNSLSDREIFGYSAGDGYITWNTSFADSVCVYDIVKGRIYELQKAKPSDSQTNSFLNIAIFGKTIYYMDHIFDKSTGRTISEINRYIQLK